MIDSRCQIDLTESVILFDDGNCGYQHQWTEQYVAIAVGIDTDLVLFFVAAIVALVVFFLLHPNSYWLNVENVCQQLGQHRFSLCSVVRYTFILMTFFYHTLYYVIYVFD